MKSTLNVESHQTGSYNFGLQLLKMFACFEVVCGHFWTSETVPTYLLPFLILEGYAVILFMIISFYFAGKSYMKSRGGIDLKKRLKRIEVPLLVWALIYFVCYCITDFVFGVHWVKGISDLFWQALTGHSPRLNASMWFNFDLLIITIVFFAVCKIKNKKAIVYILVILTAGAYVFQYTEINYLLFGNMRYELSYPLGRIAEMLPCAAAGFLISYFAIIPSLKRNPRIRYCALFVSLVLGALFLCFLPGFSKNHFDYSGVKEILVGTPIVIFSALLPFDGANETIKKILTVLTKNTMGIYCCHRLVAQYLNIVIAKLELPIGTFAGCILIYVCSYVFIELLSRLPIKGIKWICN